MIRGSTYCDGFAPSVAFVEPTVPLVEVFGSGRAENITFLVCEQEATPVTRQIAIIKAFIISNLYNYL